MSECWWAECGTFGEALDDHDLLATVLLALVAALPAAVLLWKGRNRFVNQNAKPSLGGDGIGLELFDGRLVSLGAEAGASRFPTPHQSNADDVLRSLIAQSLAA